MSNTSGDLITGTDALAGTPLRQRPRVRRSLAGARAATFVEILGAEALRPTIEASSEAELAAIFAHLPTGRPHTVGELLATVRSPQFRQVLGFLDEALGEGDLLPLASALCVDPAALAPGADVDGLLRALRDQINNGGSDAATQG